MIDKLTIVALSAFIGAVLSYLVVVVRRRRGLFSYVATHHTAAISSSDPVFGTIAVTWQGNAVANLYTSTIELHNRSPNDYENIKVRVFSNDTKLLAERTEFVDTTNIVEYTQEYQQEIHVAPGTAASQDQIDLYSRRRDYLLPVFNRRQKCRFSFLNSTHDPSLTPTLWLEVIHKGVKCEYRVEPQLFWGVPQPLAALVGVFIGFVAVLIMLRFISGPWTTALTSFLIGITVLAPGAIALKSYYWVRDKLIG